eukprot:TRINITY_DN5858_c0_g1_i2.p1 TRINITY_DN5858_c0_g1~~TRINITY_DN5858_c0_g1_i2.p1  ORF type:complete len:446 (+),score=112.14 TRINITY_DN5858_c0_g1_i2:1381-2718(+)
MSSLSCWKLKVPPYSALIPLLPQPQPEPKPTIQIQSQPQFQPQENSKSPSKVRRRLTHSKQTSEEHKFLFSEFVYFKKGCRISTDFDFTSEKGYGDCVKAVRREDGQEVGITILTKKDLEEILNSEIYKEWTVQSHPHVRKFFSIYWSEEAEGGDGGGRVFLVREWLEHPLSDAIELVNDEGKLSDKDTKKIIIQIMSGLSRLYALNLVHGNLSTESIATVFDDNVEVTAKITNFGYSFFVKEVPTTLGELAFMAPERLSSLPDVDQRSDIWSLGVLTYFLLTGATPFGKDREEIFAKIEETGLVLEGKGLATFAQDFICRCCVADTRYRMSLKEAYTHPWINLNPPPALLPKKNIWRAHSKAVVDFEGDPEQHQLSYSAGDVIYILEFLDGSWWYGELEDGQEGYFLHAPEYTVQQKRNIKLSTKAVGHISKMQKILKSTPNFQ